MQRNKKRKTKRRWLDKGINWFFAEILMTKKPCSSFWPGAYDWPETTKSDSLRCYLPLMTYSIKKVRDQMILFKEIVDQRILQSNLTRSLTDHTQHKNGSLKCYLPLMTHCMHKKLRYNLILSQDIDNQRIVQSDCMKAKPGNIQSKYCFFRCCLCLKTNSIKHN